MPLFDDAYSFFGKSNLVLVCFKEDIFESSLQENNILSSEMPSCFRLNGFFIVILNFKVDYLSRHGIQPS